MTGVAVSALLLDLDGTLVDSEPLHRAAYRSFFDARGWEWDERLLDRFTGRRGDDVFRSEPGPWAGEDPELLCREVIGHLDPDRLPEHVPGGAELVAAAGRTGVPLAVVTSAARDWVETTVGELLVAGHGNHLVVAREDVTDGKPHPEPYRLACRLLEVDPASALAVEDSPAGIRSAVAAGVGTVCGITTTWPGEELLAAGAVRVVADLTALVPEIQA